MINVLLIALAPSLDLLIYIYQKDRYDREPPLLLLKLFMFGILSTVPVYIVERLLLNYLYNGPFFQAFIVAGITEELFKFLVVFTITYQSIHYDEKLDGIVYCVFTSLGFATLENLLYIVSRSENVLYTGITRAVFSVPAHMLFAITMGYYLSLSKFTEEGRGAGINLGKALIVPILLHGIYDFILMSKIYGFLLILIVFVIYLWRVNLKRLDSYVKESKRQYGK